MGAVGLSPLTPLTLTIGDIMHVCYCSYRWFYNGRELSMNVDSISPANDGTGSFTIDAATSLDAGTYQCRAQTQYGTAVSNTLQLQRAVLHADVRSPVVDLSTASPGQSFRIPVAPFKCYPPATFMWVNERIADKSDQTTGRHAVRTDRRVQISDNGL